MSKNTTLDAMAIFAIGTNPLCNCDNDDPRYYTWTDAIDLTTDDIHIQVHCKDCGVLVGECWRSEYKQALKALGETR